MTYTIAGILLVIAWWIMPAIERIEKELEQIKEDKRKTDKAVKKIVDNLEFQEFTGRLTNYSIVKIVEELERLVKK